MILLQNPNIPTSVNPVEIDSSIIDIKTELESGLTWLTNGYGRAFKNLDITNGERVYFPEVYLGKQNGSYRYTNISPDNDKQGQCFFYVRRETISEYQTGMYSFLNYDVAVIFSVNMELIDAALTGTEVFQQVLVAQVRDVLTRQILGKSYVLKVKTVEFNFEDVFREFKMSEQSTMEKSPLSHFRFNISVAMQESCPVPSIVPPVLTCYSLLLDGVMEYIKAPLSVGIFDISDSFSFSGWVKRTGGLFSALFSKLLYTSSVTQDGYRCYITSSNIVLNLYGSGTSNITVESVGSLTLHQWHNVTITYDGSGTAAGVNMYLDGVLMAVNIISDAISGTMLNVRPLIIGGQPTATNPLYWVGNIAKSRMWNTELTSIQAVAEYNGGTILIPSVQGANLILDTDINNATFGTEWNIPDLTGITAGYTSVNMEVEDRVEDCPT